MKTVAPMAAPEEKLEIHSNVVTYATSNLEETVRIFLKHGVGLLCSEEIAHQMPPFPTRVAVEPSF
jgi:hypothetical protein